MRRKWMLLAVLCMVLCLLAGCGEGAALNGLVSEVPNTEYTASDEYVVYVEFDESYSTEDMQVALTPASAKKAGNEIPLPYYEGLNGCVTTLEEGAYCIRVSTNVDNSYKTVERYFVVNEEHSYYHIVFSSKLYT